MSAPFVVDRLSLHAGPMSDSDARRLAALVGQALGRLPLPPSDSGTVSVAIPSQQGRTVEQVAEVVARAIEAALRSDRT